MKPRQDRPRLASRVSTVVGIGALVVVAMAARSQGGQQITPPSSAAAPAAMPMPDSTMQDLTRVDSMVIADTMATSDSTMLMQAPAAVAPAPMIASAWPVDPVTGQTIINGEPVVGRVFVMRKPDGLVKLGTWRSVYNGEPVAPEPAIVGTSYAVPASEHTRRIRGIMVQATLWDLDGMRSAIERRYHRPQTTGAALGQP